MSTEITKSAASAPSSELPFIPGVIIVGADRSAVAALARRVVRNLFERDETAALVYVGEEEFARELREVLPPHRVGGGAVAMAQTTAEAGAVVHGFDAGDEESRFSAVCMIRAAFYLMQGRTKTSPFILALQNFTGSVEERRKGHFIAALRAAITAAGAVPVLCFESFAEVEEFFGPEGVGLLMRFERTYILKCNSGSWYLDLFWSTGAERPRAAELPAGKVLVVTQGADPRGGAFLREETVCLSELEPEAAGREAARA